MSYLMHHWWHAPACQDPGVVGGGCSSLRFCLPQRQERSADTCCFRPVEWKPSGVWPGTFYGYHSPGGQSLPWGQANT